MDAVFAALARAIESSPVGALAAAFFWGVLSVVLSPCHLASIPLIVGYMSGRPGLDAGRALRLSLLFALGVLGSIAAVGAVTAALGRLWGDVGAWGTWVVAAIFFAMGLNLLDVLRLPSGRPALLPAAGGGYVAAGAVGLVYGIALGPCTFAYLAPVLAVAFRTAATAPLYAGGLLAAFGLGHCAVIAGAGTSLTGVQRYLRWSEGSRAVLVARRVCGLLVLAGGLYFVFVAR